MKKYITDTPRSLSYIISESVLTLEAWKFSRYKYILERNDVSHVEGGGQFKVKDLTWEIICK